MDGLEARHHASHLAALGAMADASPGGRVVDLGDTVTACVTPARPERSFFNSVVHHDPSALLARLDDLAALYDEAGVRAWTVWVAPGDAEGLAGPLTAAGHVLDGAPELMAAPIGEVVLDAPLPGGAVVGPAEAEACGALNDRAWELDPGTFGEPLSWMTEAPWRWTGAVVDGRLRCCLATYEHDGDAYVTFVATDPAARGRGLAAATLGRALAEAARRGCTTTSLEATAMGRPVYRRMGFREFGGMQMWERRRPPADL